MDKLIVVCLLMNGEEMGKKVSPRERITGKTIGFRLRQIMFMDKHRDFKPDAFCRKAIDDQIKMIDPEFLSENEKRIYRCY